MIRSFLCAIRVAFALSVSVAPVPASLTATYKLGPPGLNGTIADYPLFLDFSDDGGRVVVFFSIDVESSNLELSHSGTDYSAFGFVESLPLLADWTRIVSFGPDPLKSVVQFDTTTAPLANGSYRLGTLQVDFSGTSLTPGTDMAVTLAAPDSVIGTELPGDPASFQFAPVNFIVIPEPGALFLVSSVGLAILFLNCFRRISITLHDILSTLPPLLTSPHVYDQHERSNDDQRQPSTQRKLATKDRSTR